MNIVLTGFMATGKTKISKAISQISDYRLLDTDDMIVEAAKMSINEIFAQYGEEYFRKIEYQCVCEAAESDNAVIATGGGVVLNKDNITKLRKNGVIINLASEFSVIEKRLSRASQTRPLLKNQDIEAIKKRFNDRLPFYADCDFKINVTNDKTPEEYAKEILALIR